MTDRDLLEQYAAGRREAFDELVRRHLGMVYAAATRQAQQAADDVVQAVFLLLAQKARDVPPRASVAGWLYRAVRYCCANVKKMENRRRHYEREAAAMATHAKDRGWENLLPILDEAMESLGRGQRDAVLLRYLEAKSIDEAARELGISADAAAKRAGRGLEKLRAYFASRGYAVPVTAVDGLMAAEAAKAAPVGAAGLVQTAIAAGSPGASSMVISLMNGARTMMMLAKIKSVAAIAAVCLLASALAAAVVAQVLAPVANKGTAHSGSAAAPTTAPSHMPDDYTIGPGDGLSISIFDLMGEGTGQYIKTVRVDAADSISLPFIDPVKTIGLTPRQLADAISKAYSDANQIQNARVSATVVYSAANPTALPKPKSLPEPDDYKIAANDLVQVTIFGLPSEGADGTIKTVRVDAADSISLPLIQPVKVVGLTAHQLTDAISKGYAGAKQTARAHVMMVVVFDPAFQ